MKKKYILLIVFVIISFISGFLGFYILSNENKNIVENSIQYLSNYDKNHDFVCSGNYRIYFSDRIIKNSDIKDYSIHDFFFISKRNIYFFRKNKNNIDIYRSDHNFLKIEFLCSFKNDDTILVYPIMFDETQILLFDNGMYVFDIQNKSLKYFGDYNLSNYPKEFFQTNYTIEEKDNISKIINKDRILKLEIANKLNTINDIYDIDIIFYQNDIFIQCFSYCIVTIFKYDFSNDYLSFFGWREVISTESLSTFFIY